jgi:hypothetical protein
MKNEIEKPTFHGEIGTRLYNIWGAMKTRCRNKNSPEYKNYGGRGIRYCDEWSAYIPFRDWALANGYRDDLTIDRIDNERNYEPSNCCFIPFSENAKKRRNTTLNLEKANEIRDMYGTGSYFQHELSVIFGVCTSSINNIIKNRTWKNQHSQSQD